jgi:hypothetical protein
MAESQVPYPYADGDIDTLGAALSQPRFATYLNKAGGQRELAVALYLYNVRVAKAFLFPLGVVEVTLRNGIDAQLVRRFGVNWPFVADLRDNFLTEGGRMSLVTAIERAQQKLRLNPALDPPKDQVVATLTFDFWSNLLKPEYGDFWRTNLNVVFPHIARGQTRHEVQQLVRDINVFRNRVAHHEPILDLNINATFGQMLQLVNLRCPMTAAWMRHYATVGAVVRTRPRADGAVGLSVATRQDADFLSVTGQELVGDILKGVTATKPVIIKVDASGAPLAAFTTLDLARRLAQLADDQGGLADLNVPLQDLIDDDAVAPTWIRLDDRTAFALAVKELQKPRIQILVGVDATGRATGAIQRAHRRY